MARWWCSTPTGWAGGLPAGSTSTPALHRAVDRGEVEIHFQPLVSLRDRRIVGAEALVRWNHPDHGSLLPAEFLALAEDNGAIVPIGVQVLQQACRQAQTWQQEFGVPLRVGVNLSARQLHQDDLPLEVARALRATGLDPRRLCLEIAESLAMQDVHLTSRVVSRLHTVGVAVAIDDFGTGPFSLGSLADSLARCPFDIVKIDPSLVRDMEHDPVKSTIVSAAVALSRAIGSTTIVEGVETLAQVEALTGLGCDVAQGYYFSRPVSVAAFGALLAASASASASASAKPGAAAPPDLHIVRGNAPAEPVPGPGSMRAPA